jgi:hypothetical protein
LLVYETCAFLEYEPLQKRIEGRLRGTFYNALPTVDKIKVYQALIPSLYKYAVRCLCNEMVHPWACNYVSYYELAEANQTFGKDLGDGLRKLIDERVMSGKEYYQRTKDRHVIWAIKYVDGVLSGVNKTSARKPAQSAKKTEGEEPNLFNKSKTTGEVAAGPEEVQATSIQPQQKSKAKQPFTCYNCGGEGHLARNCNVQIEDVKKAEREEPICYGCNETGHIRRNCPVEQSHETNDGEGLQASSKPVRKPKTREPFLCYNCSEEGHISRDCTVEVAEETVEFVGASITVKDTLSRNKHFRRTQRNREIGYKIDTNKFSGGNTTCDCEVKKSEKTRTGLII